jgi:hypothetical protein
MVYKTIDIIGSSTTSFADATKNAIEEAAKTVRGISEGEVAKLRVIVKDGKVTEYLAEIKITFAVER